MSSASNPAPGAPGIEPRWTSSAKDGVGTAYHSSSRVWFTLSHGIVNEVYYPHVDTPNTRDLQFLITDGETFCHEERRDLDHELAYPEQNVLLLRLTNTDRQRRYRLIKEVIGEPHSSVLLVQTRLEILDPALHGKLRLYALLAPHVKGTGKHNSGAWDDVGGRALLQAEHGGIHLALGAAPGFTRRSVGYVGTSDGWQDLMDNFKMDWSFDEAREGNIALTGEIDLSQGLEFVVAVGFGHSAQSAATALVQALATPFTQLREKYVSQWQRTRSSDDLNDATQDGGHLLRLSRCVLLAHEDKTFPGAFVASLSIPWGETKDDSDRGGYHLVWTRDMVQTATALLACGWKESPLRALIWLACVQLPDGRMPQNSSISGKPYWEGIQLDEVAGPIVLAWRLRREGALRQFDPWTLISRAARYLISHGPVAAQERWEENSGYSPSTLAEVIAALICAADFARDRADGATADFLTAYADWLSDHLELWMVTDQGELMAGHPRHYLRLTPAQAGQADGTADPNHAWITLANGGGDHPARNVVGGDFLQLVRLGIRAADDAAVVASVAVIDQELRRDLPEGPCWRRYNHDGYGQKADGGAFDGTGIGRSWPMLTGERGHYELSAGRDSQPFITAMEKFGHTSGLLPEQVWDEAALASGRFRPGDPSGSAMPLCWAHAEYVSLVRSCHDGVCFDRIEPVFQRYARGRTQGQLDIWTFAHRSARIRPGHGLRIITEAPATIHWTSDGWKTTHDLLTHPTELGLYWADLPAAGLAESTTLIFTFHWTAANRWEGRDFSVKIARPGGVRTGP